MNQVEPLPISGYRIEKVYSNNQRLCVKQPDGNTDGNISVGWDWRVLDPDLFEVSLVVSVQPTPAREEFIEATIIGRFRQAIPEPTVPREDFVKLQAPAILLPYLREVLSALSSRGYFGTYYLPSLNVVRMMQSFDHSTATGVREITAPAAPRQLLTGADPGTRKKRKSSRKSPKSD